MNYSKQPGGNLKPALMTCLRLGFLFRSYCMILEKEVNLLYVEYAGYSPLFVPIM